MLVNRQERAVMGMFRSAPKVAVIREAELPSALLLLNTRQRRYGYRVLAAPISQPIRDILQVTLREMEE